MLTLDNKLGLAPPNEPGSGAIDVLDIGTGTGIWAVDYAHEHPDAQVSCAIQAQLKVPMCFEVELTLTFQVIGVDLSPIQPSLYVLNAIRLSL